jgi:hypothetical protein
MSIKRIVYALTGLALSGLVATAATIPPFTGAQDPSQIFFYLNTLIAEINAAFAANGAADFALPRNLLDNGQMQVQQRGTGTRTCGTTTIPSTAYAADRWGCNVNVSSGAGVLQVITTGLPAQPVFNAGMLFYRNSGALAQPQCVMQEIATTRITPFQGQSVTLSFYAEGLAAMLAETTTLNAYLFTGTGSDQGLQTFTASPAITPAWTNIASTQTAAFTLTSAWKQFQATFNVGGTVTEAAVALCWTPTTGGTAGVTDGFQFTGVQLEYGTTPSSFELRSFGDEFQTALRYYYRINDNTTSTHVYGSGVNTTTSNSLFNIVLPVPMRIAPTATVSATTAFGDTATAGTAAACTGMTVVASSATVDAFQAQCSAGATVIAGGATTLVGENTAAFFDISADF